MKINDTQTAYGINASPNADGSYDPRYAGPDPAQKAQINIITALAPTEEADVDFLLDQLGKTDSTSRSIVKSFRRQIIIAAISVPYTTVQAENVTSEAHGARRRPPPPTTAEHKKIAEDWYTWGFQVGIEVSVPLQAAGTQIGRETVTIYVPDGYHSADEFLSDCGFEQACPAVQPASQDRPVQGYWPREMIDDVAAHGMPRQTCNCLMCLAEGENSPHRRRAMELVRRRSEVTNHEALDAAWKAFQETGIDMLADRDDETRRCLHNAILAYLTVC